MGLPLDTLAARLLLGTTHVSGGGGLTVGKSATIPTTGANLAEAGFPTGGTPSPAGLRPGQKADVIQGTIQKQGGNPRR